VPADLHEIMRRWFGARSQQIPTSLLLIAREVVWPGDIAAGPIAVPSLGDPVSGIRAALWLYSAGFSA